VLASNPVDPSQIIEILYQGPSGPASPYRRDDERGVTSGLGMIAAASLLVVGYVVGGFAAAQGPDAGPVTPAQPAAKVPATPIVVDQRVPGEFRLGPGNNQPPGVVRFTLPEPATGDFRLAPGNLTPGGVVGR
jgi:hypothetical protein